MAKFYEELNDIEVAPTGRYHVVAETPLYNRTFDHVLKFHPPGVAPVRDATGAFHINTEGEDLYSHRFEKTFGFYGKLAAVQSEEGWYHITLSGHPLYEERYQWCGNFQEGFCPVQDKAGAFFHINFLGQRAYEAAYTYVGDFKDGVAVVHTDKGATHIDRRGTFLHGRWFLDLDVFHKGFARVRDTKGWCHLTKEGQFLYKERYQDLEPFYNGVARATDFEGRSLLLNEQGQIVRYLKSIGEGAPHHASPSHSHQNPSEDALRQKALQELSGDFVGFWALEVIKQALHLGLLDLFPACPSTLSSLVKVPEETLLRLLRALEEIKIVEKISLKKKPFSYQLTKKGALLCPTYKAPMAAAALMWEDTHREWNKGDFLRAPIRHHPTFKERCSDERKIALYQRSIDGYAQTDFQHIDQIIDWKGHLRVLGLGRVSFTCLTTILKPHPHLRASYYYEDALMNRADIPASLQERLSAVGLSLLNKDWPPCQFDAVVLPRFLHYFPDSEAKIVLSKAKQSLANQGKLYIFEMLLSDDTPAGGLLDINMLVESGGKLRTLPQWKTVLNSVGLKLASVQEIHPHLHLLVGERDA